MDEAELKQSFDLFDGDNDGLVTPEEFSNQLKQIGMSSDLEESKKMLESITGRQDMNFDEFKELMLGNKEGGDSLEYVVNMFSVLDQEKNGLVNAAELKHV